MNGQDAIFIPIISALEAANSSPYYLSVSVVVIMITVGRHVVVLIKRMTTFIRTARLVRFFVPPLINCSLMRDRVPMGTVVAALCYIAL